MLSKMLLKQRPFGKKIESFKTKTASEIPPYNAIAEETGLKGGLTLFGAKIKRRPPFPLPGTDSIPVRMRHTCTSPGPKVSLFRIWKRLRVSK